MKRNYLLSLIVIGLISLSLYSTYAMFTASIETDDIVNLTASTLPTSTEIVEYERITVEKNSEKTIEFTIKNSTSKTLYYGTWYEMIKPSSINDNIVVARQEESEKETLGQLNSSETAKVSLIVKNNTEANIIINLGVGYGTTSSLNLPENRNLITDVNMEGDLGIKTENFTKFNTKGLYGVNVICSDSVAKWNYINWNLVVSGITMGDTCNVSFNDDTQLLESFIRNNVNTTQGQGQIINEPSTDYRYEGKDPNNYVLFNNELWRIIGVFSNNTHGQSGYLTKIIRNDSIGGYAWDKNDKNNWSASSLKTILNNLYYNQKNGTSDASCYFYSTTVKGNCDFSKIGLDDYSKNMIQTVAWKLGGRVDNEANANTFYNAERGTTVYGSNVKTVSANIGLMYPSDFGYSVLASDCSRTNRLYDYGNCSTNSWLLKNGNEWTLTHGTKYSNLVFHIAGSGSLYDNVYMSGTNGGILVRPVVYLKSNVYITSGDGSISNPYVLGI